MLQGMMARKIGMTQIFEDDGRVIPVTVLEAGPVTVVQKKTMEKDGCDQVQVGYEAIEERKGNRPMKGHFREQAPTRFLREFKVEDISQVEVGQSYGVELFSEGEMVKVSGTSKGKGFTGVMKRHGFGGQPASHGHRGHRGTGSIGQCATPSRVFKGKKCTANTVTRKSLPRDFRSLKSSPSKSLSSSRAQYPAPMVGWLPFTKTPVKSIFI